MKKYKRKYLEKVIKMNKTSISDSLIITRELKYNSFFIFMFSLLFLVYSLLNRDHISKLATITADTIFNHEVIFSPTLYYFVCLIILVGMTFIVLVAVTIISESLVKDYTKKIYTFYRIYDFISFIISILVAINFIVMFIITPVTISGDSMQDTYNSDDKVFIWHFAYSPMNDDVIIFDAESIGFSNEFFIKRIVASPNDELSIVAIDAEKNGYKLYRNGIMIEESISKTEWYNITGKLVIDTSDNFFIPENKYLIMGDNRQSSFDGRSFGLITSDDILGKVIFRYYPFDKMGLPNPQIKEN